MQITVQLREKNLHYIFDIAQKHNVHNIDQVDSWKSRKNKKILNHCYFAHFSLFLRKVWAVLNDLQKTFPFADLSETHFVKWAMIEGGLESRNLQFRGRFLINSVCVSAIIIIFVYNTYIMENVLFALSMNIGFYHTFYIIM